MPKAVPEMSDEEACDILFGIDDAEIDRRWIQQFCNAILRAHDRQQLFISWPECSINSEFSERGTDFHFQVQIWGVNSRVRMRPDPRRRHHGRFTV
jgi:hypothetical protein